MSELELIEMIYTLSQCDNASLDQFNIIEAIIDSQWNKYYWLVQLKARVQFWLCYILYYYIKMNHNWWYWRDDNLLDTVLCIVGIFFTSIILIMNLAMMKHEGTKWFINFMRILETQ